jgi:shikimate dehydrogenase
MEKFGLVGYPLGHSFSKKYFTDKFEKLSLSKYKYDLYEMEYLKDFPALWNNPEIQGVNVTVPHKENVMRFLDLLDSSAQKVGAVNVVKRELGKLKGYNTDYLSFKETLLNWLPNTNIKALVLGSGGSSKAVQAALDELNIDYEIVSRSKRGGDLTYQALNGNPDFIGTHKLIIDTTPLGTYPNISGKADIPYDQLTSEHFLYDLVYNPAETAYMLAGKKQGAQTKNGLEMLKLQAEKSWEIWMAR